MGDGTTEGDRGGKEAAHKVKSISPRMDSKDHSSLGRCPKALRPPCTSAPINRSLCSCFFAGAGPSIVEHKDSILLRDEGLELLQEDEGARLGPVHEKHPVQMIALVSGHSREWSVELVALVCALAIP